MVALRSVRLVDLYWLLAAKIKMCVLNLRALDAQLKSMGDVQSVLDHPIEQLWDVAVLDYQRRAKPLRVVVDVLAYPLIRSLSEWPNECKRSLWQDPNVGFVGRAFHCLPSVLASGGAGLIGNSGRKTAKECDMHAKETTRNTVRDFTAFGFIILLRQ